MASVRAPGFNVPLVFVLVLLAPVFAQVTYTDLPSCAIACFGDSLPANASSDGCILKPNSNFENSFSPCFYSVCSPKEVMIALNVTSIICDEPVRDISFSIRAFVVASTCIASIVIALRVIVKFRGMAGGIGWDDWTIVLGVALTLIAAVGQFLGAYFGLGRDAWKLSYSSQVSVYKCFYVAAIGYKLANAATRISLLFFYLRIFGTGIFRFAAYTVIAANVLIGVAFALADALQCSPPSNFWNGWDGEHAGHCASLSAISWVHSILNIILDIITLAMAVWIVRNLNMRWRKKAAVIGMFILGSAITLVSFLRLQALPELSNSLNRTWDLAPVSYWSGIEMLAGLVCACLPALNALGVMCCGTRGSTEASSKGYKKHSSSREPAGSTLRLRPTDPAFSSSKVDDLELSPHGSDRYSITEIMHTTKSNF